MLLMCGHGRRRPQFAHRKMTLNEVRALLAAEKAAKDVYYAANKTRTATKSQYNAMVAATKARCAAMTAYAATLA